MSDIHQMTTPLGEIALGDAMSYIDRLRAEVYRARSERDALSRKAKEPCEVRIPGARLMVGDLFIHSQSGRKHYVESVHTEQTGVPSNPHKTTFHLIELND
jgi:hypothetical protein